MNAVTPQAEVPLDLKYFTSQEQLRLRKTTSVRIQKIAQVLDNHLGRAIRQSQENSLSRSHVTRGASGDHPFCEISDGEGGSFSDSLEKTHFHQERSDRFFVALFAAKERFLSDPLKYGFCRGCGKPIPLERLEEVPHTSRCVPCKMKVNGEQ